LSRNHVSGLENVLWARRDDPYSQSARVIIAFAVVLAADPLATERGKNALVPRAEGKDQIGMYTAIWFARRVVYSQ